MLFKDNWQGEVYRIFYDFLKSKKEKIQEIFNWERYKEENPFHATLIDDPKFWKACKIERSFVTTLGQSVYEDVALAISKYVYKNAEKGYTYTSSIDNEVYKKINMVIRELYEGKRKPNWESEVNFIKQFKNNKNSKINLKITMDLYINQFKDGLPFYAEIKSPKPNKDQCMETKLKLLRVFFSDDWRGNNIFFAFPFNPYITRDNYDHPHIKAIFEIPRSSRLLMGEEFWDLLGGKGTFKRILELADKASDEVNLLE